MPEYSDEFMDNVLRNQSNLESFEVEHISAALNAHKGTSPEMARSLVGKISVRSNPGMGVTSKDSAGIYTGGGMATVHGSVAEFSIIIVRNSSRIKFALPIALFMNDFLPNEYRQIVANNIPAGVTLVSVATLSDRVRFTYSNGVVSDQIDILADTSAYPSFLNALNTNWFQTSNIRMEANSSTAANTDTDASRQFKTILLPYFDTLFGSFGGNRLPLTNCKPPNQFLKNVIDVPQARFPLSPRQGYILPVINATTETDVFTLSLGHYVQRLVRSSNG